MSNEIFVQIKIIERSGSLQLESAVNEFLRKVISAEAFKDIKVGPTAGHSMTYTALVVLSKGRT
jgi:hypothetical protein